VVNLLECENDGNNIKRFYISIIEDLMLYINVGIWVNVCSNMYESYCLDSFHYYDFANSRQRSR